MANGEVRDDDCVMVNAQDMVEALAIAVADGDEARQQFLHQRLFQVAIVRAGEKVHNRYLESVRQKNTQLHEEEKVAAAGAGRTAKGKRNIRGADKEMADKLKLEAIQKKSCFTLGFRERCCLAEGKPNAFLSQVLLIAKSSAQVLCCTGRNQGFRAI